MDRTRFYTALRRRDSGVFGTSLSQQQVKGVETILDEAQRRGTPLEHVAYMLATSYHETGHKMVPNAENLNYTTATRIRQVWPSRFPSIASARPFVRNPRGLANKVYNGRMGNRVGSDDGWSFRGRGLPHLTGRDNYRKASEVTGVDLLSNPDRALEMPIAVKVFFDGMTRGWYTGKSLIDYIRPGHVDYRNARRIVNALDKATAIAGYARAFEKALREAEYAGTPRPAPLPQPKPPTTTYTVRPGDTLSGIGARLGISWPAIADENDIGPPWVIQPGQVLRIPAQRPAQLPQPVPAPSPAPEPPRPPVVKPEPERGGLWAWLRWLFGGRG